MTAAIHKRCTVFFRLTIALCLLLSACGPPPKHPSIPEPLDGAARASFYEKHRLDHSYHWFSGHRFSRGSDEYNLAEVAELSAAYADTKELHGDATTRNLTLAVPASAGGFAIGYAAGSSLGSDSLPAGTQTILYSAGAGLIVITMIVDALWKDPADQLADAYNRNLRRDLGLPEETSTKTPRLHVGVTGVGASF